MGRLLSVSEASVGGGAVGCASGGQGPSGWNPYTLQVQSGPRLWQSQLHGELLGAW